jgi:hypothetical protein
MRAILTTMNDAQTIFSVFYAIFWGAIFSVSARWKAFNFGAIFDKGVKNVTKRIVLAKLIFNILPILYFILVLYLLSLKDDLCPQQKECLVDFSTMVLSGIIPAFGIFGFYRLWMGIIEYRCWVCISEKKPQIYYLERFDIPLKYRGCRSTENVPEPSIEKLGILDSSEHSWRNNIIVGFAYITLSGLGLKQPILISFIVILLLLACICWSFSNNLITLFIILFGAFIIFLYVIMVVCRSLSAIYLLLTILAVYITCRLLSMPQIANFPMELRIIISLLIIFAIIYLYPGA